MQKISGQSLPQDIVEEIASHLDTESLRNFSVVNLVCNDIANYFLWKHFSIIGLDPRSVLEQFTALVRLPRRASHIQRLVIGPFRFSWTKEVMKVFPDVWGVVPNLKQLILNGPYHSADSQWSGRRLGGDFMPLIHSLARHGCHLRLRTFKCTAWLRPDSDIHRFLVCQANLQELIGVDLTPSRLIEVGPDFLPSLEVLVCHIVVTAERLLPGRHIRILHVYETLKEDHSMAPLAYALRKNPQPPHTCKLRLRPEEDEDIPSLSFSALCSSLNSVKAIDFGNSDFWKRMELLPSFDSLEYATFEPEVITDRVFEAFRIAKSLSPVLRCLRFKVARSWLVWTRRDLDK